jgi:peptidoglycan/LPS O-acetylase OafA/YrhL
VISRQMGRVLSAVGALLLILGLFLTWYHIDRTLGSTDTTGWQTFTRLRFVILGGAVVLLLTALFDQGRGVLIVRTVLGLVLGALILRRIIDPPNVDAPISSQFGVVVGLIGAICAAAGGLVDTGREVAERYPDLGFRRAPGGLLGPGGDTEGARRREPQPGPRSSPEHRPYVDSSAEEM